MISQQIGYAPTLNNFYSVSYLSDFVAQPSLIVIKQIFKVDIKHKQTKTSMSHTR